MGDFVERTPEAQAWIDEQRRLRSNRPEFGRLADAVLWLRAPGEPEVGPEDPSDMVDEINRHGWPVFVGHDPGKPSGMVVAAKQFSDPSGAQFVAGIVGLYTREVVSSFEQFGLDFEASADSMPPSSEAHGSASITLAVDPREVSSTWIAAVCAGAPLQVNRQNLSNNAAEFLQELVRVGIPYALLLWNPFVKKFAEEAGRDAYVALRDWLKKLIRESRQLKDPVLCIDSVYGCCQVTFILRSGDVQGDYAAHATLPDGARRAYLLVDRLKARGEIPARVLYEFHAAANRWYPVYAALTSGKLIADHGLLIAVEQTHTAISIGVTDPIVPNERAN
jgi:hypothetical protein